MKRCLEMKEMYEMYGNPWEIYGKCLTLYSACGQLIFYVLSLPLTTCQSNNILIFRGGEMARDK